MSKYIVQWDSTRVIAAVSGRLVQNMDRAAEFAMLQARARAPVGVRWVEKGVRRSGSLRRNIIYEVAARGNVVEGRIGARKGIYWAWFVERGTRNMRARPFLRPAVFENAAEILRLIRGGT